MAWATMAIKLFLAKGLSDGTDHWVKQRISSIILVPLTVIFTLSFVQNYGLGYEQNIMVYKQPLRAFLTFLFFSLTFLHFKQGAEVVIDDYIDNPAIHRILLKINTVFFFGMNIIVFFALSRIVLDF